MSILYPFWLRDFTCALGTRSLLPIYYGRGASLRMHSSRLWRDYIRLRLLTVGRGHRDFMRRRLRVRWTLCKLRGCGMCHRVRRGIGRPPVSPSHVYHARPTTRTGDARARNVNALGVLSNMLLFVLPLMAIDVEASTLFTGFAPY